MARASEAFEPEGSRRSILAWLIAAGLCAWIAYSVATYTLVAYLGTSSPTSALELNGGDARSLLKSVERRMAVLLKPKLSENAGKRVGSDGAPAPAQPATPSNEPAPPPIGQEDMRELRSLVRKAVDGSALSPRAMRILGQFAVLEGDRQSAERFMSHAVKLSRREVPAVAWLFEHSLEERNLPRALEMADILLRTQPETAGPVAGVIANITETEAGLPLVAKLLSQNPPWRKAALDPLFQNARDLSTPLRLFLELKSNGAPVRPETFNRYLTHVVSKDQHELAYYAWLQFLPKEKLGTIGLVYNGDFREPPSGAPFDWTVKRGTSASIQFAAHSNSRGTHGLNIQVGGGRVEFGSVHQWLMLSPGRYRLKGLQQANLESVRGFRWQVTCRKARNPLAQGPMLMGRSDVWSEFSFDFEVPAANCLAQRLALIFDARSASEKLVRGSASYDALRLEPVQQE